MTPPELLTELPECLDCGACCHSKNPRLIELLGADAVHLPVQYIEQSADGTAHMRMIEAPTRHCWVCSALGTGNVCQVYARRPFLCREFERGSPECRQAIADMKSNPGERKH